MAETLTLDAVSAVHRRQVNDLRKGVGEIAEQLGVVREKARDIAPRIMKLFGQMQAEYDNLGGFIGFARLFDDTIPTHADDRNGVEGYRKHKTYYALDYLRRLQTLRPRGRQGVRDPATDQLARLLATVFQVVAIQDPVWEAVKREFRLQERGIARLKSRVENAKPLLDLSGIKQKARVTSANIIHMDPMKKAAQVEQVADMNAALANVQGAPARRRRAAAAPAA